MFFWNNTYFDPEYSVFPNDELLKERIEDALVQEKEV